VYLRAKTPREKDPQTLTPRDCLSTDGFPLGESEWGQTRAQLALSTPTRVPSTASSLSLSPTNILDRRGYVAADGAVLLGFYARESEYTNKKASQHG